MEEELVVQFSPESSEQPQGILPVRIVREIWREITFGVGTWVHCARWLRLFWLLFRSLFSGSISIDSTVERLNGRSFKFMALTLLLWIGLYLWSIFDAWRDAVSAMGDPQGQS